MLQHPETAGTEDQDAYVVLWGWAHAFKTGLTFAEPGFDSELRHIEKTKGVLKQPSTLKAVGSRGCRDGHMSEEVACDSYRTAESAEESLKAGARWKRF